MEGRHDPGLASRVNVDDYVGVERLELPIESLVHESGQSAVGLVSGRRLFEQPFAIRIGLGFPMGQRLVPGQRDEERWRLLAVKGPSHRHVVGLDPVVKLIILSAPAPEGVGIAAEGPEVVGRQGRHATEMISRRRSRNNHHQMSNHPIQIQIQCYVILYL